ncbi:MAG: hypothetical protein WA197_04310 [Candidatus Acidiferrales bacterium]
MSERCWKFVSVKFAWRGLLVGALCLAPGAWAQGQAGTAAAGDAAGHSQNSSAAKTPAGGAANSGSGSGSGAVANSNAAATSTNSNAAAGQNAGGSSAEPEMVDQSAPSGKSLAEAARQARARKAKAAAGAGANAPKVYTEDKLSQLSGRGVSVVGDGNAGGSGASSSEESSYSESGAGSGSGASAAAGAGSSGEEYWRGRARAIRDQMAQCDQEISKLQDEIAKYGAVSVDPQSGAMQSIIYVNDRNAKIKQIQDRKDGLQGQLDALEDEGRKAGADAGWFR